MSIKTAINESAPPDGQNVLLKIDVKAGDLSYGQRIGLGELFMSDKSESDKFKETFHILHDKKDESGNVIEEFNVDFFNQEKMQFLSEYFTEIIEGLKFWIEKEKLLKYDQEPEEIRAGIKELGDKIGYFGTLKAVAKNYSQDPDNILEWKYGKVWGILYTDLEEFKYSKKLHKEYEKKWKRSGKY